MSRKTKKIPDYVAHDAAVDALHAAEAQLNGPDLTDDELALEAEALQAAHDAAYHVPPPMSITVTTGFDTPGPDAPSLQELAEALAEIDPEMETAASAGVIDHHSQLASWTPLEDLQEAIEEREVENIVAEAEGVYELPALDAQLGQIAERETNIMVWNIRNALDEREEFEERQSEREALEQGKEPNKNIFSTLKKVRSQMVTKRAAKLLCAIQVDPGFINRSINTGARYNVYALGKLGDVVYGVTDGQIANAVNLACMKTLFAFRKAGLTFDMMTAKGCCSRQFAMRELSAAIRQHLISHTQAPSTASTQASSTMQALTTLGVVRCDGAGKNASYTLTDAPITRKLESLLAA